MMRRVALGVGVLVLLAWTFTPLGTPAGGQTVAALPQRLTDHEFWALSQDASEPGAYFRSADITNLTSNEQWYQHVIPDLVARVKPGGVYLGVGPEQNFTYMTALRPMFAAIVDIRRGNLDLQLMYKAIFELSRDRAEFVSMLFAKPRPAGLGPASTADQIFAAFGGSATRDDLYTRNLAAIKRHLTETRGLPLPVRDLEGIEAVYRAFFFGGYYVRSSPSYWDLMTATDRAGAARSYLSTEAGFAWLKDLQARNLVVPVVGDFGGPRAIRAIGAYLKARGATATAFYLSNVEQYLFQDGKWTAFCRNVAGLPLDASSTFIRSSSGGGGGFVNTLGAMAAETRPCEPNISLFQPIRQDFPALRAHDGPQEEVMTTRRHITRYAIHSALLILLFSTPAVSQTLPAYAASADLSGPRFGLTLLSQGVVDALEERDITVRPFVSQFGWQFERQFFTKGSGVTMVSEWVALVGGLEQGVALPSLSWLVGVRTRDGAEFGIGPNITPAGTALVFATGMTFRTGAMNIPVNVAIVPSKRGTRVSLVTGFSLRRR